MTLYKNVNGVDMALSPEEEAEHLAREVEFESTFLARTKQQYVDALTLLIDTTAQQKDYTSALSCASYVQSTNIQWSDEADAFVAWRDVALEYAYEYLDRVQSGEIINPTIEDFIAGVPVLTWPIVPTP